MSEELAEALRDCLISTDVLDSSLQPSNIVDAVDNVHRGLKCIADAITPRDAMPGHDGNGVVKSLTEAVMGMTLALQCISMSLDSIASELSDRNDIERMK